MMCQIFESRRGQIAQPKPKTRRRELRCVQRPVDEGKAHQGLPFFAKRRRLERRKGRLEEHIGKLPGRGGRGERSLLLPPSSLPGRKFTSSIFFDKACLSGLPIIWRDMQ